MAVQDYFTRSETISFAHWVNENSNNNNLFIQLHEQESLPEIYSIKKMCIIIAMGKIIMQLGEHEEKVYSPGNVINVPGRTRMKIKNFSTFKTAMIVMEL